MNHPSVEKCQNLTISLDTFPCIIIPGKEKSNTRKISLESAKLTVVGGRRSNIVSKTVLFL